MDLKIWAVVRKEEIVDSRTFLSKTHLAIIAENLTRSEAESYLDADYYKDLSIIRQKDLDLLKSEKKAAY